MTSYINLIVLILCVASCRTISVNQEKQHTTTQNLQLGAICERSDFILNTDYNHTALPKYKEPIRLQINSVAFNKTSFKAFKQAKTYQNKTITVNYIDSIATKPQFLKLEVADRVAILTALNNTENKNVSQFIQNTKNPHIVTSISAVFNAAQQQQLVTAEAVFLEQTGNKTYGLTLYKKNKIIETLVFNEGVVFSYQASNFCWKQNSKYQLELVDSAERNNNCAKGSYRSAKRATKKINYFKL